MKEDSCACGFRKQGRYCISNIRLFRDLPAPIQEQLIGKAVHSSHARGSFLVANGDEIRSALIIRSGKIKISRSEASGEEHILDVLHDGQAVWHGIFLKDHVYHYDVICLTDVQLCEIPREELLSVFRENPQVTMNLIGMLSTELDEAEEEGTAAVHPRAEKAARRVSAVSGPPLSRRRNSSEAGGHRRIRQSPHGDRKPQHRAARKGRADREEGPRPPARD